MATQGESTPAAPRRNRKPLALAIAAALLLVVAVVLWFALRSDEPPAQASSPLVRPAPPVAPPSLPGEPVRPGQPTVAAVDRPAGSAAPGSYRETVINGVRVRDHRKNPSDPIDLPPNVRPPDARKLPPELTREISNRLLPVVTECAASVPREARGTSPRVEGVVAISIKDKQVAVTESTVQLRDVVGASVDPTKQCLEQKMVGVTLPAGEQADLDRYTIHVSFAIGR